jgi:hypothetical protein
MLRLFVGVDVDADGLALAKQVHHAGIEMGAAAGCRSALDEHIRLHFVHYIS